MPEKSPIKRGVSWCDEHNYAFNLVSHTHSDLTSTNGHFTEPTWWCYQQSRPSMYHLFCSNSQPIEQMQFLCWPLKIYSGWFHRFFPIWTSIHGDIHHYLTDYHDLIYLMDINHWIWTIGWFSTRRRTRPTRTRSARTRRRASARRSWPRRRRRGRAQRRVARWPPGIRTRRPRHGRGNPGSNGGFPRGNLGIKGWWFWMIIFEAWMVLDDLGCDIFMS